MSDSDGGASIELAVVAPFVTWDGGAVFDPAAIPLHVTVLSNFRIAAEQMTTVLDRIRSVATSTPPLVACGGGSELFGPLGDIEVTTLAEADPFVDAHRRLFSALGDLAVPIEPSYQGAGYRAHVTAVGELRLGRGERIRLNSFAVLDCTNPQRVVIAAFLAAT